MKKTSLLIAYFSFVAFIFALNSCQQDEIVPNPNGGYDVDSTWVNDSTTNPGGGGICDSTIFIDSTGNNPNDSSGWIPFNGGIIINDSID